MIGQWDVDAVFVFDELLALREGVEVVRQLAIEAMVQSAQGNDAQKKKDEADECKEDEDNASSSQRRRQEETQADDNG